MPVEHSVLNVKELLGPFNQVEALVLVGAFPVIMQLQTSQRFVSSSTVYATSSLSSRSGCLFKDDFSRLFNEGFYLHSRITVQIFNSEAPVLLFNIIGWGGS